MFGEQILLITPPSFLLEREGRRGETSVERVGAVQKGGGVVRTSWE